MLQADLIFPVFERWLWFSCTSFSVSLLSGWSTNWSMFDCTWLFTHARCAAANTRDGGEKKSSGRGDHNGVGVTFICTQNVVCVGSGPPSLILYQLTPSPHPQTHTNTAEETDLRPRHVFLCFLLLFFPPLCSQDLLHSSGWAFLKLQVGSSLVKKEGRGWEQACLGVGWGVCVYGGDALCVCVWVCDLSSSASVESFRLSHVAWLCDCCERGRWWYH